MPEPISPELQAAESAAISGAVGPGAHYTLVANPGSVERIQGLLGSSPYQIVHFLGHGAVDTTFLQQSYLLFEGEAGQPQLVTCEQLPRVIGAASETQLVVLNACHGASVEIANNVAMQLVYHGIPYVVAMQGEIAQQAAIIFARTFYTALQARSSLEDAVTLGRMQMAGLPDSPDWCLPALFVSQGTVEKTGPARVVHTVEIWLSQPVGQRQLGNGSIALGVAQLVVATLLLLSGAAPPLPAPDMLVLVVGLLAPLPPLMAIAAYRAGGLALPVRSGPSRSVRAALLLRSFTSAALGMGLVAFYSWLTLQLAVAMGFWALLSPIAEGLLLVMLFAPCVLVSWQQALSHAAGLVSNHAIEAQKPGWGELAVVIAGYLMLCGPPLLLWLMPEVVTPPLGNLLAAILLIALGYQVRRQSS